jgi:DNA primase catalytic core
MGPYTYESRIFWYHEYMTEKKDFKSIIAQVKLAYNLADYIQQSGIQLKSSGVDKWKGLCPFHNEKTPSFVVNDQFQNYRCFGCGAHGDLLSFVENYEHLDFIDALKKLAEDKNIEITIDSSEQKFDYKSLRAVLKDSANFFYREFRKLPEDHAAKKQILSRGLSLDGMRYGYAPEGRKTLYKFLSSRGYSDEVIQQAGVCIKFEGQNGLFDFWHGRLMFFITDITGKPVGFSGRKLFESDKRGKYVNSPDGPLFDKSSVLFHLSDGKKKASEENTIYVAEGQFDVASLVEAGLENSVASSGTAFTDKQAMICRRLVSDSGKIVFCFDGDSAGQSAARKVFSHVPIIHSQAYVVSFPDNEDPCDFRLKNGNEALRKYVSEKKVPIVEFVLKYVASKYDLSSEVEKSHYIDEAASVLKTVSSDSLREAYIKTVALEAFISTSAVKKAVIAASSLSTFVEKEPAEKVSEDEQISDDETTEAFILSSRLLALTFDDKRFMVPLAKMKKYLPKSIVSIAREFSSMNSPVVIPENFENSDLSRRILESQELVRIKQMTEDEKKEYFVYLKKRLENLSKNKKRDFVQTRIFKILESSPNLTTKDLKKALEKEEEALSDV